jgi:hypothetical protein
LFELRWETSMRNAQLMKPKWQVAAALAAASVAFAGPAGAQPHVWSGLPFEFVKPDNEDPPFTTDSITSNVSITRGVDRGLYNPLVDDDWFDSDLGPSNTRWATIYNNEGQTIAASNWANLNFEDQTWLVAYGGGSVGNVIEGTDAVMYLVLDNVYLDLRVTHWQSGGGGGFAYLRAEPPAPTGDYNGDLVVNAADYTVWRNTLGQAVSFDGAGADGDGDRMIDYDDFLFWRDRYGDVVGGAGASQGALAQLPEPASAVVALAILAFLPVRRIRNRTSSAVR